MRSLIPLVLLGATQAHATLSPCVTDDLMRQATIVVQIVDQQVEVVGNNVCRVSGTVVVAHRGSVDPGRNLTASFNCVTNPESVAIGGTVYSDPDAVRNAGALEVHIGADGFIAAEGNGLLGISAPTQYIVWTPYCG